MTFPRAACRPVRELGFPEAFIRMWEFYLCYCEAGFRERTIGTCRCCWSSPDSAASVPLGQISAECP
jgi:cyclopropane-fatty-acyl-phospholipid synthase